MKKVIICKGLPASGKTTWAKKMIDENPGMYKRVNKDDLRAMLDNGRWSRSNEKFVLAMRDWLIVEALSEGKHVIVDDTNLHCKHEARIRGLVLRLAAVEIKEFDTPLDECLERDSKRQNPVGAKVINDMYVRFLKPAPEVYEPDPELSEAIICDIDGTLAEMDGRSPYEWGRVGEDKPKQHIIDLVNGCLQSTTVILFTGRDAVCRKETEAWLDKHGVRYDQLYMRPELNNKSDVIVKKAMYDEHVKDKYKVNFILDDRDQVVELWRSIGLTCLQVDYGNF